jgi:hypothetical protein
MDSIAIRNTHQQFFFYPVKVGRIGCPLGFLTDDDSALFNLKIVSNFFRT